MNRFNPVLHAGKHDLGSEETGPGVLTVAPFDPEISTIQTLRDSWGGCAGPPKPFPQQIIFHANQDHSKECACLLLELN
jgi:hypothetical protein